MDTTKTFACALVALLLGASACSTGDETEAQIARLSARIVELEYEIAGIDSALNRCIDDVLREISSKLSWQNTGSAGRHSHWYEGDTETGHTHTTTDWMILSTPLSC